MRPASTPKVKRRATLKHLALLLLASAVTATVYFQVRVRSISASPVQISQLDDGDMLETATAVATTEVVSVDSYSKPSPRAYHVVTTAQGTPNHWQIRIHYFWYLRQKASCELQSVCDMGGFTRLLHSGTADDLMDEIPTVVVDPLPEDILKHTYYVVLNRPYAVATWVKKVSIPEKYVLMAESDHIFLSPMPNLMQGENAAAAPFSYMEPAKYPDIVKKFTGPISPKDVEDLPRIGNSPTIMSHRDLQKVADVWLNTSIAIWNDKEAHEAWNWILEMYGFCLATFIAGLRNISTPMNMMAHPPWESKRVATNGQPYYILHYTYPMMFNSSGQMIADKKSALWKFDKREYSEKPPPRNLPTPPAIIQNELAGALIEAINTATDSIPCWDQYAITGKVEPCASTDLGVVTQ